MHELGLARNIVAIVSESAEGRAVARVRLAVGPRACVERRSLSYCFGIASAGTPLDGATLEYLDAPDDTLLIRDFEREGG
ncbi:MAG: hydrogenase maturation nickel metallochaperone HypA [Hyphomicrobiales bacterium]|nr:hydrogenase maturation nickel metallochaperone HypA [Hyphomicrobiales bacterium]MDE2018046.1 hydrogenase maturation nickel metallochaperone HypA [Hyphomicrobiales bacterium]